MRGRPFSLVKERVNLAVGESNLCDAAIEYDDLLYGSMQNLVGFWISHIRRTA